MRTIWLLIVAFLCLFVSSLSAEQEAEALLGWRSDFDACRKEAEQNNIPLVLIWGTAMCSHCRTLKADLSTNETFLAWREKSGYLFCSVQEKGWKDHGLTKRARIFAATAGGTTKRQPSSYPFVCLYHKKPDGTAVGASFSSESAAVVMADAQRLFSGLAPTGHLARAVLEDDSQISLSSFKGHYTVQLPIENPPTNSILRGTASLVLDLRSPEGSDVVMANYSGVLPDGSSILGSAPIVLECITNGVETKTVARVDIVEKLPAGDVSLPLAIKPFAARAWKNPSVPEGLPAVFLADGAKAIFHSGSSGEDIFFSVYGGFFRKGQSLKQVCTLFDLSQRMVLRIQGRDFSSERYGKVTAWPRGKINAGLSGFSPSGKKKRSDLTLSYSNADGTLRGRGAVKFGERSVKGAFKGVVLPGWVDCHCGGSFTPRPFAAGLFSFNDYQKDGTNWTRVVRSVPFEIIAK